MQKRDLRSHGMTVVRRSRSEEESGKPADEETNKESASEAYL